MSLRILMVLDHTFPTDIRVENEALSLIDAGHEVSLLAVAPDDRPAREIYKGIEVVRDRISADLRNKMRGLAGTVPILTWYLSQKIEQIYSDEPFDVLHVHDLYLFGGGLRAASRLGVPMVGDLHENWVEALKHYAWSSRFPGRLFVSTKRWQKIERRWINAADRLIVVIEEAAERNAHLGVPKEKLTVVPNTVRLAEFGEYELDDSLARALDSAFTIVYTGGFDRHRGLHCAIQAMQTVVAVIPGAELVLVGDGRIRPELEEETRELRLQDHVRFTGWQPHELLKSYMAVSDLCLVPHLRTEHTDATIPHKLFHYMYMARPVVVSDCRPLKRIVNETGAGRVFKAGDPASLSEAIVALAGDTAARKEAGARGRAAVLAKYCWERTVIPMIEMYDDLERSIIE